MNRLSDKVNKWDYNIGDMSQAISQKKILFTPGPVEMADEILKICGNQIPYFRNDAFSKIILRCEELLTQLANAPDGSRVIFLTGSGTAAMEASIINLLQESSNAIIINGGTFGERFCQICTIHHIPHQTIFVAPRQSLLLPDSMRADALLVNGHETSIGRLYDLEAIGAFCKERNMLHIVDAISLFVTDKINMREQNIDALILSSHKGLALPPGIGIVILSPKAIKSLRNKLPSLYFNFKIYLEDGLRGQTPFTPAVGILLALHQRLETIHSDGIEIHIMKAHTLAKHFRNSIITLPLRLYSYPVPNALTALEIIDDSEASSLVQSLEIYHGMILTPNSGQLSKRVFRVSHMGEQNLQHIDMLVTALSDYFGKKK